MINMFFKQLNGKKVVKGKDKDKAKGEVKEMREEEKKPSGSKMIRLDMDDLESTIFSSGLNELDTISIIQHFLRITPWSNQMKRTKLKNFIRALTHLVVYIHYLNEHSNIFLDQMVGNGVGYMNQFDLVHPIKTDEKYNDLVSTMYKKATKGDDIVSCVWHPTATELENWSGNMRNYFFTGLKQCYLKGTFSREDEIVAGGLFGEWYTILKSLGIKYDS